MAALAAALRTASGDPQAFTQLTVALFSDARKAVDTAIGLAGALAFWLGLMRVAEAAGLVQRLSCALTPLFRRLMPEVPAGHPAIGALCMNLAANVFGLDNAATPLGIQAMRELQKVNPRPNTASNPQILFLVLNTSSVTLLPASVFALRAQAGASQPTDVFLPIVCATSLSTLTGLLLVTALQRLNLLDRTLIKWWLGAGLTLGLVAATLITAPPTVVAELAAMAGQIALYGLIAGILAIGLGRGVDCLAVFVAGVEEGLHTAWRILPYLIAMLTALGALRASGLLDALLAAIRSVCGWLQWDTRFVDGLPTALVKPISGSAARAALIDTLHRHGPDSFAGRLAAIVQGSTETTFYVLAVYFGAVGITRVRYAAWCGLAADSAGVAAAIALAYWLYG